MGATEPEIRFELANEGGCCVVADRVAHVDLGNGGIFTIRLDELASSHSSGSDVYVRMKVGRIIDFGGVRWDGAYPPIRCATVLDAQKLANALLMRALNVPPGKRKRPRNLPNPFSREEN